MTFLIVWLGGSVASVAYIYLHFEFVRPLSERMRARAKVAKHARISANRIAARNARANTEFMRARAAATLANIDPHGAIRRRVGSR